MIYGEGRRGRYKKGDLRNGEEKIERRMFINSMAG